MLVPETEIIVSKDGAEILRKTVRPGEYVIGREPECDVPVAVDMVSRRHAQLTVNYDHALIEDLGSSNGTFVNGRPVTESTRLWPNQKIQVGAATIEIHRVKTVPPPDVSLAPQQAAVQRLLPEDFLNEKKYDIGKVVAQGGMGAILDAKDATIERRVAMKVMLDGSSPDDITRFVAEAKITGQLEHPNVVPVHELSVDENGQPFYTMKMVRGITLRKVLELLAEGNPGTVKKYPLAALLTIFQKVCDALAFAHSKGVIHRDLKPENIMLDDFGVVLVMDWGLAKVIGRAEAPVSDVTRSAVRTLPPEASGATLAGTVMGTPQYMSPEQARGEVEALDARSDLYALGAILYHIVTLRAPVTGGDAWAIVAKVARGEYEPLTSAPSQPALPHLPGGRIPEGIAAVIRQAMTLDKAGRYATVADFQRDIDAYQSGRATRAENAGIAKQLVLLIKRHKALFGTAFAAWLIITALAIWFVVNVTRAKQLAQTNEKRATDTLAELRAAAPTFEAQAKALLNQGKLDEALAKIGYATKLVPENVDYRLIRANLLEATQQISPAADEYRAILTARPGDNTAKTNLALCEKLLAASGGAADLSVALQNQLFDALLAQHRDLEAAPLAARLNRSSQTIQATILARLASYTSQTGWNSGRVKNLGNNHFQVALYGLQIGDLSVLRGLPIAALSLIETTVSDLRPLAGLPLDSLDLESCPVTDLSPLRGMKLRHLDLYKTQVKDLSPLAGMPLEWLQLSQSVSDLSLLREMPLKFLDIHYNLLIADLRPLAGLKLEELRINGTNVTDLTPLHGMPLKILNLGSATNLRDFSPLAGNATLEEITLPPEFSDAQLLHTFPNLHKILLSSIGRNDVPMEAREFFAAYDPPTPEFKAAHAALASMGVQPVPVHRLFADANGRLTIDLEKQPIHGIEPLHGLPIDRLFLSGTGVKDLEPLRGSPIRILRFDGTPGGTDMSPLADCPELEGLVLPGSAVSNLERLRGMPKLRYLSYRWNGGAQLPADTAEDFWKRFDAAKGPIVAALQKMGVANPTEGMLSIDMDQKLVVKLANQPITDLAPLAGFPIHNLDLGHTGVSDLGPLKDMPLDRLILHGCPVSDLSPLRGMPLQELSLGLKDLKDPHSGTKVSDLSPLRGLPLHNLHLDGTLHPDVSPLADCPALQLIVLPPDAQHVDTLRKLPNLQRISFGWPGSEDKMLDPQNFWKQYDAQQAAKKK